MKGFLVLMLTIGALSTVGCGKKKPTQQQMVNACLFDPTGVCPRQAAAMAQAGIGGIGAPGSLPYITQIGQNPNILTNGSSGGVVRVASVTNSSVRQQALRVQSAIAADSNNPNSLHYDPPQSSAPQRDLAAVAALQAAPTQNEQVGLAPRAPESNTGSDQGVR